MRHFQHFTSSLYNVSSLAILFASLALFALGFSSSWLIAAPPENAAIADAPPGYPPLARVRADFHKMLDRPKVDPDVKQLSRPRTEEGLTTEHLSFASERKADGTFERVPMLVVRPEKTTGRLPTVIVLHGTGGNKEGERGTLVDLARRGMIGVAIDARYHGERVPGVHGADAYNAAIIRAWRTPAGQPQEHPFYYDTCWDLWRTVDYLTSRADVDPQRLGMIGFSMGGIETWLAASVDSRIHVAVPAIGVQSLRWSLDHERWQGRAGTILAAHQAAAHDLGEKEVNARVCRALWSKICPGILDEFDCPSMLRLFADRPLLILNGELDPNNPLPGARLAFAAAEDAYGAAHATDRLEINIAPQVGHQVTAAQHARALAWFEHWLLETK